MKIKISYEKTKHGQIKVIMNCIDKGDYITTEIFNNQCYPDHEEYKMTKGYTAFDELEENNAKTAKARVNKILDIIEDQLMEWRNIELPENEIHEF